MSEERRDTYVHAMYKTPQYESSVDAVMALVDAEIEAATKTLRQDAETRRLAYVSERDLRREIEAERDALRAILRKQPEPEYEYAIRGRRWQYPSDARFGSMEEVQEWLPRYTQKPSDWVIMRRVVAGEWEDVK